MVYFAVRDLKGCAFLRHHPYQKGKNMKNRNIADNGSRSAKTTKKASDTAKARNQKKSSNRYGRLFKLILLLLVIAILSRVCVSCNLFGDARPEYLKNIEMPSWVDVQIIDRGDMSRTGRPLEKFSNVVVHYVANPMSTAQQNRDYFQSAQSSVSAHFVVGLNGEIIQCIPLHEQSSASNDRNKDTISIEVCHPDTTGKFNEATYNSLIKLCAWLCDTGKLKGEDVIRHYDVTGKICPKYFVDHEDAWAQFKNDVQYGIDNYDFKEMAKDNQTAV